MLFVAPCEGVAGRYVKRFYAGTGCFFVSEKANAFAGMKLNDEFYFATAKQIYRIMVSPQAKKKL